MRISSTLVALGLIVLSTNAHATHKARSLREVMAAPGQTMAAGKSGKIVVSTANGTYIRVHAVDKLGLPAGVPVAAKAGKSGLSYALKPGTYIADATESGQMLGERYFLRQRLFTITAK